MIESKAWRHLYRDVNDAIWMTDGYHNCCVRCYQPAATDHGLCNECKQKASPQPESRPSARPLIYIAGPFRAETPWAIEQNIRQAEDYGLWVAGLGGIPLIPHTMYRFYQNSLPDAFWLEAGLALLRTCAAVAVCVDEERAQKSMGTVGEIGEARRQTIPVFYRAPYEGHCLPEWIKTWTAENFK